MHYTAMLHGKLFFRTYLPALTAPRILDLGAQDVNGSLRSVAPPGCEYVGADFTPGRGVDVLLTDPYALPFPDASFDVCVSSSCFEHAEFFWLAFVETMRVLRPGGLFFLNAPSNGRFHRYPVDCWRFYPDAGKALENWGRRSGYAPLMLECFTGCQRYAPWNDYIAVFTRDAEFAGKYPNRIIDSYRDFTNGMRDGSDAIVNRQNVPEDRRRFHWPTPVNRFLRRFRPALPID
jgi:SAM-dependent methyltransferase